MQSSVRALVVLSVFATVHCAYCPKLALKSRVALTCLPEKETLGLSALLPVPDVW